MTCQIDWKWFSRERSMKRVAPTLILATVAIVVWFLTRFLSCNHPRANEVATIFTNDVNLIEEFASTDVDFEEEVDSNKTTDVDFEETPTEIALNSWKYTQMRTDRWGVHFLFSEKHKVFFCDVEKIACTQWRMLFLRMNGDTKYHQEMYAHKKVRNHGIASHVQLSVEDRRNKLFSRKYAKAVVTREPHSRFLSAFLDGKIDGILHSIAGNRSVEAFTVAVSHVPPGGWKDPHVFSQWDHCALGVVPYDFVGEFRTMKKDSRAMLTELGLWDDYGRTGWGHNRSDEFFVDFPDTSRDDERLRKYYFNQQLWDTISKQYADDMRLYAAHVQYPYAENVIKQFV